VETSIGVIELCLEGGLSLNGVNRTVPLTRPIAAMLTGIAVVIWSAGFMHKKHASLIFLLLFILLFLVGGGVAQVISLQLAGLCLRVYTSLSTGRKRFCLKYQHGNGYHLSYRADLPNFFIHFGMCS